MDTQVAIIGGGPAGLLLSQLLNQEGIDTVILERETRETVLARIRAGILEWGTVELLREAGVGARMDTDGMPHDGCMLSDGDRMIRIDFRDLTGKPVMVFGQTEVTEELYKAQDAMGTRILHSVTDVELHDLEGSGSHVIFTHEGESKTLNCRYIAGCDGSRGKSREAIPADHRRTFDRIYPFGWLGILSRTPPAHEELIYANSPNGFALASMRNANLSRYYIQVPKSQKPEEWSDDAFWAELKRRLPAETAETLVTGPSIEKSIAPLRSFVSEPMRWGNLFLAGDATHIVPPTGAKGLNLAVSDIFYLHQALIAAIKKDDEAGIDGYSAQALQRVWKAVRFSWQMTTMMHKFDDESDFDARIRQASLDHIAKSEHARQDLADNYIGLPF